MKIWSFVNTRSDIYDCTRKSYDTESVQEDESDEEYWGVNGSDSDPEEEDTCRDDKDNSRRQKLPPIKVPLTINTINTRQHILMSCGVKVRNSKCSSLKTAGAIELQIFNKIYINYKDV